MLNYTNSSLRIHGNTDIIKQHYHYWTQVHKGFDFLHRPYKLMQKSAPQWIQIHHKNTLFGSLIGASWVRLQFRGQGSCCFFFFLNCILREREVKIRMHEYKWAVQYVQSNLNHRFFQSPCNQFQKRSPQMRKMMSSATMTWLSSCMRARADRTSGSVKRVSRPLLMSSIRVFIFTDWAWADWNTANREDLNSFSLVEETSRDPITLHSTLLTSVRKLQTCHLMAPSYLFKLDFPSSLKSSLSINRLAQFQAL